MNKLFNLYQQVLLSKDLPEHNLQKGDVATIVEIIEKENKRGYCLEFFDSNGDTLKVIIVTESGHRRNKAPLHSKLQAITGALTPFPDGMVNTAF